MRKHWQTDWINIELWELIGLTSSSKKATAVFNFPDYSQSANHWFWQRHNNWCFNWNMLLIQKRRIIHCSDNPVFMLLAMGGRKGWRTRETRGWHEKTIPIRKAITRKNSRSRGSDQCYSFRYIYNSSVTSLNGWMTRQIFLADQNQCVSKPTWVE